MSNRAPPPPVPAPAAQQQPQRVRVEDALSYLDEVKQQFASQIHVYTSFLDIMKEFKSQTINTPGVIARVARLFAGRPQLITGFNAFLPAGFEVRVEPDSRITIHDPSGHVSYLNANGDDVDSAAALQPPPPPLPRNIQEQPFQPQQPPQQQQQQQQQPIHVDTKPAPSAASTSRGSRAASGPKSKTTPSAAAAAKEEVPSTGVSDESEDEEGLYADPDEAAYARRQMAAAKSVYQHALQRHSALHQRALAGQSQAGFTQALSYVNKIKHTFRDRPLIYKKFLEILRDYQLTVNQAHPLDAARCEADVLAAVANLFRDQPNELLEEFKEFLPDVHSLRAQRERQVEAEAAAKAMGIDLEEEVESKDADVEASERGKKGGDEAAQPQVRLTAEQHRALLQRRRELQLNEAIRNSRPEDLAVFDKIRNVLGGSSQRWTDFLRTLNLYASSLIDKHELMSLLRKQLRGHPSLVRRMDEIVRAASPSPDDEQGGEKDAPTPQPSQHHAQQPSIVPRADGNAGSGKKLELQHAIDYSTCRQLGVSYRSVPASAAKVQCSGRKPFYDQFLNDTWVSFPSWASEDASCATSKKTQYEEMVYRTEDERFELDICIEVNKYAIEALEMVRRRMARMKPEEAQKYRLDDKLGATSASHMTRAITRLYGEHANKIVDALKKNPVLAVPRVLDRLKEKDKHWREAQNVFNKIWRDQHDRYYVRSLDHQTVSLKNSDSKWIKAKQMVTHIENLYDERLNQANAGCGQDEGPHIILRYPKQREVFADVSHLLIHHIKRLTSITKEEKRRVKLWVRRTLPAMFQMPEEQMSDEDEEGGGTAADEQPNTAGATAATEQEQEDEKTTEADEPMDTGASSATAAQQQRQQQQQGGEDSLTDEQLAGLKEEASNIKRVKLEAGYQGPKGTYRLVYGSNNLYVFLRFHQTMCYRLGKIKAKCDENLENYKFEQAVQVKQRELFEKYGKGIEGHEMNASDPHRGLRVLTNANFNNDPTYDYRRILGELRCWLDGAVEASSFEDELRELLPTQAYLLFTFDRLIQAASRQLQSLALDKRQRRFADLFEKYAPPQAPLIAFGQSEPIRKIEAAYEDTMKAQLADENCFRILLLDEAEPRVAIELLDTATKVDEDDDEEDEGEGDEDAKQTGQQQSGAGGAGSKDVDDDQATETRSRTNTPNNADDTAGGRVLAARKRKI